MALLGQSRERWSRAKIANENTMVLSGQIRDSWPSMAALGDVELTKTQKLLESKNKNKNEKAKTKTKTKMKSKTKTKTKTRIKKIFRFCFHFCFCFHFRFFVCFCFHFRFCFCFSFRFFINFFFFSVLISKCYYGTSRPPYCRTHW